MELSNGLVFSVEGSSSLAEFAGPTYQPWVAAVEMRIGNTGCSSLDGINNWLLNTVEVEKVVIGSTKYTNWAKSLYYQY